MTLAAPSTTPPSRPRETVFVEMVFPDQANHYGTLYGGNALGLLGKAAFVTATRFARCAVVMAASGQVDFHVPVKLGQMLELTGRILRVGRTSMSVEVSGVAETLAGGERTPALRGRFEMVAVDGEGRPRAIGASLDGVEEAGGHPGPPA